MAAPQRCASEIIFLDRSRRAALDSGIQRVENIFKGGAIVYLPRSLGLVILALACSDIVADQLHFWYSSIARS
jgi:hypothetical protein